MGFFRFIIGIPLIVAVAVVAFMNNEMVSINLWPFYLNIQATLSIVIIALVVFGYIVGKLDSWAAYSPLRSALRSQRRQNKRLNVEQQKLAQKFEGLKENLENMKAVENSTNGATKTSKFELFKQKMSGLFKKKAKRDDFWCL